MRVPFSKKGNLTSIALLNSPVWKSMELIVNVIHCKTGIICMIRNR